MNENIHQVAERSSLHDDAQRRVRRRLRSNKIRAVKVRHGRQRATARHARPTVDAVRRARLDADRRVAPERLLPRRGGVLERRARGARRRAGRRRARVRRGLEAAALHDEQQVAVVHRDDGAAVPHDEPLREVLRLIERLERARCLLAELRVDAAQVLQVGRLAVEPAADELRAVD